MAEADGAATGEAVRTGRVLGVDLGARRIGVAVSDDGRRVASALCVLARAASRADDHTRLAEVVAETGANRVVVGLPLSLSGGAGPAAKAVEAEVAELRAVVGVPVECCDERFSTVVANRALSAVGRRAPARRSVVDKVAAAAILQTWLDRSRPGPGPALGPLVGVGSQELVEGAGRGRRSPAF